MTITRKDVEYVANLARLKVSVEESELYTKQLGAILDFIQQLKSLDTEKVEPTSYPIKLTNVLRRDEEGLSLTQKEALKNAPEAQDGQFRVPQVIEG